MTEQPLYMDPDRLVDEYSALVRSLANRYSNPLLSAEDLFQEGIIGLLEANKRFDPSRGTQFGTYAHYWIAKRILGALEPERETSLDPIDMQAIPDTSPPIAPEGDLHKRLPENMPDGERRVIILSYEQGMPLARIAELMGISRERVKQIRAMALRRIKAGLNGDHRQ